MPLFETQKLVRSGHHWPDLSLTPYFQLDINKMIHVHNRLQLSKISTITKRKFGLHPTHLSNQPNPTLLAQPTNPTKPNITQPNLPTSHPLRPRMWSVKNPWCRAKRYVFICTKIVQVLERSNAMSLPKGGIVHRVKNVKIVNCKWVGGWVGWSGKKEGILGIRNRPIYWC